MPRRRFEPSPTAGPSGLDRLARPRRPEALPVTLRRGRRYILPTAFGMEMGLLLLATLIIALNNGNNHALAFSVLASAVLGVALIQTDQRLMGVRLLSIHAFPAHAGEEVVVRVSLDHRGRGVRRGLRLRLGARQVAFDLPDGEPLAVDLRVPGLPRGCHPMGRLAIETRRPANIARAWGWVWPRQQFLIYPRLEDNAPAFPRQAGEADTVRSARQGSQVHHLRDWRLGDAVRDVAWKASARQDKLMAREYEDHSGGTRRIEWQQVAHLPLEQALSRLARWVVEADGAGMRSELVLPGRHIGPGQGLAHRHACLAALALVDAHVAS